MRTSYLNGVGLIRLRRGFAKCSYTYEMAILNGEYSVLSNKKTRRKNKKWKRRKLWKKITKGVGK